ncbi:MAG: hypothetical protein KC413_16835, partial [Anaerolineales bacterium]|nr:hypothetical protein [Anaerolineales bacterium]
YYPFGDYRAAPTSQQSAISDRGFTGHKSGENGGSNDIGLIYMNARFYVPGIGRFASADTVVPNFANPQSFNRYSYAINNPLYFVDPSGHFTEKAITDYLEKIYKDDAQYIFEQWKNNTEWWEMLRLAQAGDVLCASVGERGLAGYYHFLGEGQDVLSGVAGSISRSVISDDYSYFPESLGQLFNGNNNTTWGGLFVKNDQGQIVNVFHRMSVTNVYEAAEYLPTSSAEAVLRGVTSAVVPEALYSPIGGFATGVGCEAFIGEMIGIVAPHTMIGSDFVISPLDVSPGDLIYVSAGHVFRYDAGLPSLDEQRTYNRLDMYYYGGNGSLIATYHLITRYQ